LILVDGGKGQLSAANEALRALQLSPPTLGLAKRFEQLFVPGQDQPIVLLPTSPVLHLIQRIRDEAHRCAVTYHRRLRGRRISVSALHAVPGIGRQRAAKLLRQFGSVASMRRATLQDLQAAGGVGPTLAQRLVDHLRRAPAGGTRHG
jgi:excinuclease ABC subunit C